jgi:2,3-bisphosphoglycerate-independent phosphoglycerate mutase
MACMDERLLRQIVVPGSSKIVLLVMDGLGGLPHPQTGRSELETAHIPNLDRLARDGACGLTVPVALGVTPGSGPGHLALFGYDPIKYDIGRGVLEATGIDFDLHPDDVAARGNFCTVDAQGIITDRRAGRIPTEEAAPLIERLRQIHLPGVQVFVEPVREHRFVLVFRRPGLSDRLSGTDPNREGLAPLPVKALEPTAQETADLFNRWVAEARRLLADQPRANMVLVRGFAKPPVLPSMAELFQLKAAAVAIYPMYRGLAKLVGMTALPAGHCFADEVDAVAKHWPDYDFFFIHFKGTDTAGEDGDFERKARALEEVDREIPRLLALAPDVLMVAGDHSTPAIMAGHSWHPVPFVLHGRWVRPDPVQGFSERECLRGSLGTFPASEALPLALAHAGRLTKYGA